MSRADEAYRAALPFFAPKPCVLPDLKGVAEDVEFDGGGGRSCGMPIDGGL